MKPVNSAFGGVSGSPDEPPSFLKSPAMGKISPYPWAFFVISQALSMGPAGLLCMVLNGSKPPDFVYQGNGNRPFDIYMRQWDASSAAQNRAILWTSSSIGAICFLVSIVVAIRNLRRQDRQSQISATLCLLACLGLLVYAIVNRHQQVFCGPAW